MRPLIPALAGSALVAAVIVWAPLPGQDDPPDPAAAAVAVAGAQGVVTPSPAIAYVKFAPLAGGGDAAGAAGAATKPGPPVLVGLAGAGRDRAAYIMDDGSAVRARVGDKFGKWRLAAIGPHSVTLRSAGKSMQLAFYGPREAPPPAVAPDALAPAAAPPAAAPAAAPAPAPTPVQPHALEPASARVPRGRAGGHRYWVGPPGTAPPGYIQLKPGEAPPQ